MGCTDSHYQSRWRWGGQRHCDMVASGSRSGLLRRLSSLALFGLRHARAENGFLAEAEVFSLLTFLFVSTWWAYAAELTVGFPFLAVPLAPGRLAVLHFLVIAVLLGTWHTGNIVLGVLKKRHVLPSKSHAEATKSDAEEEYETVLPVGSDSEDLRHGRLIGYLERLLIIFLIVQGSYEGLGFLIAAKGLIRAKEWERDRGWAEYFLVGSLLSVLCAVAIGTAIRIAIRVLW